MKLTQKSLSLRLVLGTGINLYCLSLMALGNNTQEVAYRKELKEHHEHLNKATEHIKTQHRNLVKQINDQAQEEHKELDRATNNKLALARKITNYKDRTRTINRINEASANLHKDANDRRKTRLANNKQLRANSLRTTRERHNALENSIRAKYGKKAIPVKLADTASANKPARTNKMIANKNTKASKNGKSRKTRTVRASTNAHPTYYSHHDAQQVQKQVQLDKKQAQKDASKKTKRTNKTNKRRRMNQKATVSTSNNTQPNTPAPKKAHRSYSSHARRQAQKAKRAEQARTARPARLAKQTNNTAVHDQLITG